MVLMTNDGLFLDKLKDLYDKNRESGTVWVTFKRYDEGANSGSKDKDNDGALFL